VATRMTEAFRERGCDVSQAAIEFTEPKYLDRFSRSVPARRARHCPAALATAATETGQIRIRRPRNMATTIWSASVRHVVLQDGDATPLLSGVGRGGKVLAGKSFSALRVCGATERQSERGQAARHRQGRQLLDGIRFTYEGGQSLIAVAQSVISARARCANVARDQDPPTNLKADFGDQARAFANH